MEDANKFAGWALCLVSLVLLASLGRLDLLVVLLPLSAVVSLCFAAARYQKLDTTKTILTDPTRRG